VCEFRRGCIVLWAILLLQISDVSQTIDSEGISMILPECEGNHLSEHTFYRIQNCLDCLFSSSAKQAAIIVLSKFIQGTFSFLLTARTILEILPSQLAHLPISA
jgi:hypothetical protein